jgi:hypothetical protein
MFNDQALSCRYGREICLALEVAGKNIYLMNIRQSARLIDVLDQRSSDLRHGLPGHQGKYRCHHYQHSCR